MESKKKQSKRQYQRRKPKELKKNVSRRYDSESESDDDVAETYQALKTENEALKAAVAQYKLDETIRAAVEAHLHKIQSMRTEK